MINNQKIINRVTAQQIPFLLCFFLLFYSVLSLGQVRFIKTFHNVKNYTEVAKKIVEIGGYYYIPIITGPTIDTLTNEFYILQLDKKGNIVGRRFFDNWSADRGDLYENDNNTMWKFSSDYDTIDYFHFVFTLLDIKLNELLKIKVPRTFPANGWPMHGCAGIKLKNGDYIFMQGVAAFDWKPFKGETNGNNFIYLTKDGVIKSNKSTNEFNIILPYSNNVWQLNDTSIIGSCQLNGCKDDCLKIVVFDFKGNIISTKNLSSSLGLSKKCGNRFYGFRELGSAKYSFICLNENLDMIYEKKIPDNIQVRQFWDNRDNNDFRILASYSIYDTLNNSYSGYITMIDTSFTLQKLRLFSDDENDDLWGVNNLWGADNNFYATKDGGGLFLFNEIINEHYDDNIVMVKIDTNYAYTNTMYSKKDENIIHPNPNNTNRLYIETDIWENITVYDYTGFKVHYFENSLFNTIDSIDISAFKKGLYYLSIKLPDKVVLNTFIRH